MICEIGHDRLPHPMLIDEDSYRRQRRELAYTLSEFMVPYLLRLYHAFDGDMAELIVLGEIGQRNASRFFTERAAIAEKTGQPVTEDTLDHSDERLKHLLPCNALSIAESTGLPRETVRRKVNKLIKRGWLKRESDGCLYVTSEVSGHFEGFNLKTIQSLLLSADRIAKTLDSPST